MILTLVTLEWNHILFFEANFRHFATNDGHFATNDAQFATNLLKKTTFVASQASD
jgi:hypothetical protein